MMTIQGLTDEVLVESDSKDDNSEFSSFRFDISSNNIILKQLTMHELERIHVQEYNSVRTKNSKLAEKNAYLKNMVQELMEKIDTLTVKEIEARVEQLECFYKILMKRYKTQIEEISQLTLDTEARDIFLETFKVKESTKVHTSKPATSTSKPTATSSQQAERVKVLEKEVNKLRKKNWNLCSRRRRTQIHDEKHQSSFR